jgi:hypothetical protein
MIGKATGGLLACAALIASAPSVAEAADFGIAPSSVTLETIDGTNDPDTRAGAHPDRLRIDYGLVVRETGTSPRDIVFELSPGLTGNPTAIPACARTTFNLIAEHACPPETRVGTFAQEINEEFLLEMPVYNVEPTPDQVAAFGAQPFWSVPLEVELRPSDHGLTLAATNLVQLPNHGGYIELWGIPADHQVGTSIPRRPLLTTPTRCAPITMTLRVRSWEVGAPWLNETADSAPFGDCESLPFEPALHMGLTDPAPDALTGTRIDLTVPEDESPDGRASSQIENAMIALPPGLAVTPGGVQDRQACTDNQFGLDTSQQPQCPQSSRIGSVELESPLLRSAATGHLYLGEERPGDRFRLLIAASIPGSSIKLVGSLHADPLTGSLSANLADLPQLPITRLSLEIDGGPRALLATPRNCGQVSATALLTPYSGASPVGVSAPIEIGPGASCPATRPFAPGFVAGSSNRRAGRKASFSVTLTRQDGEEDLHRLKLALPPGLNGAFGALPRCPASVASSGSCSQASKIGDAIAEVGPGPAPAVLHGDVYLTEPYRNAPFGLSISFRATIGPFDLGTIATRATVSIDRHTGQVTVSTDPLPEIVGGVPIRFRMLGIDLNRSGLIRNPTSCAPASVSATIQARGGKSVTAVSPFALGGCHRLGFRPKVAVALKGESQLRKRGRPRLSIVARTRPGDTNIRAMRATLPRLLQFDASRLREICAAPDAERGLCSRMARIGSVRATTPLLDEPLRGGIYVVQPDGEGLPDLAFSLRGKGVEVDLKGTSGQAKGRFVTEMVGLPDMSLSKIRMTFPGGRDGLFVLREGLCARGDQRRRTSVSTAMQGQDGAFRRVRSALVTGVRCGDRPHGSRGVR